MGEYKRDSGAVGDNSIIIGDILDCSERCFLQWNQDGFDGGKTMQMKNIFKKILRLGAKILLIPVFCFLFVVKVFAELLLNIGSWVVGLVMMLFLFCIGMALFRQQWSQAVIIFAAAAGGILVTFAATAVVFIIQEAFDSLVGFMGS